MGSGVNPGCQHRRALEAVISHYEYCHHPNQKDEPLADSLKVSLWLMNVSSVASFTHRTGHRLPWSRL
jgi:hypothetical protein